MSDKARDFIEKGRPSVEQENPGGLLCYVTCSLVFYGERISFWVVSGPSF